MSKKSSLVLWLMPVVAMVVSPPPPCQAGLFDWVYESDAMVTIDGQSIEAAKRAVQELINDAKAKADDLLRQVRGIQDDQKKIITDSLNEAERVIQSSIDRAADGANRFQARVFQSLMKQQVFFFRSLDEKFIKVETMAVNVIGIAAKRQQEIIEQVSRDLERILDMTLFGKDLTTLQQRKVVYQDIGQYRFEALGKAFGLTAGKPIMTFSLRTGEVNALCENPNREAAQEFGIPVENLNPEFADLVPTAVRLRIVTRTTQWDDRTREGGADKRPFIALAPKFPVGYELTETLPTGKQRNLKPILWEHIAKSEGAEIEVGFARFLEGKSDLLSIRAIDGSLRCRKVELPRTEAQLQDFRQRLRKDKRELQIIVGLTCAARLGELSKLSEQHLPFGHSEFELSLVGTYKFEVVWFLGERGTLREPGTVDTVTLKEFHEASGRRVLTVDVGDIPRPRN